MLLFAVVYRAGMTSGSTEIPQVYKRASCNRCSVGQLHADAGLSPYNRILSLNYVYRRDMHCRNTVARNFISKSIEFVTYLYDSVYTDTDIYGLVV